SIIVQPECPCASTGSDPVGTGAGRRYLLGGASMPHTAPPPARQPVDLASISCGSGIAQSLSMIGYPTTPRRGSRRARGQIGGGARGGGGGGVRGGREKESGEGARCEGKDGASRRPRPSRGHKIVKSPWGSCAM